MTTAIINAPQQAIEPTNKREYYDTLTDKETEISKDCGKRYRSGSTKFAEGVAEAGTALIEAKEKLGHGKFMYFCKHELPTQVSQDSIENLMSAARLIKANPTLIKFNPSAIFALSKKSVPPEVVAEMSAKAEANEPLPTVAEIKEVIAKAKATQPLNIKKGDLVEWDIALKGYRYGRVVKKSTDGISVKVQNLDGMPLGERPAKFVSLCPIQKVNENCVNPYTKLQEGDFVTIKPYCSWLQEHTGTTAKVIHVNAAKGLATVMFEGAVLEMHWHQIQKVEPQQKEAEHSQIKETKEAIIDVEATEVSEEKRYINGLPLRGDSEKEDELQSLVNELYARMEELDNTQIQFLLDGLKAEAVKRPWARIKSA